jgi:hypothetical protein
MEVPTYIQIGFVALVVISIGTYFINASDTTPESEVVQPVEQATDQATVVNAETITSKRGIAIEDNVLLPIKNIIPTEAVKHSIALDEIRQGCSRQDCIPSVDSPEFISVSQAAEVVDPKQIGIALSYKEENRFYPFSMLVTKEIVNDVVAGDPLLITYCPLCGTGIVFSRVVDSKVYEFGVSGMLWQSNLLMYNRADDSADRNLWSQVLGEAVVGNRTGTELVRISSDIMKFEVWAEGNDKGLVLDTGSQSDPYNGEYYAVAQRFAPDYSQQTSPLAPDVYVYGIEVENIFKAYPRDLLPVGEIRDMINDEVILISNRGGKVRFETEQGVEIADTEGFWFSWVAVHPETLIWGN